MKLIGILWKRKHVGKNVPLHIKQLEKSWGGVGVGVEWFNSFAFDFLPFFFSCYIPFPFGWGIGDLLANYMFLGKFYVCSDI